MSAQTAFEALARRARSKPQVQAGLQRTAPALRAVLERHVARWAARDATPGTISDEAMAFVAWGSDLQPFFFDYHQAIGGLARVVEVVLAATLYEQREFEWDSREWSLRRAGPSQALASQGLGLWVELKRRAQATPAAQLKAALTVLDAATTRSLLVRAAFSFVFPQHKTLWRAEDDAAVRRFDVDDLFGSDFAVLSCLRGTKLELKKTYGYHRLPPASAVRKALGPASVSALRLMREWKELAALGTVDALRVLAEFADRAVFPDLEPKRALEPLASVLTTHRPSRQEGLRFALGFLQRAVAREPKWAQKSALPLVQECLVQSGVLLPPAEWTSPWAASAAKVAAPVVPPKAARLLPSPEVFHWTEEERENLGRLDDDVTAASSKRARQQIERDMKRSRGFLFQLSGMTDAQALQAWKTLPARGWYGNAGDLQHVLIRFGAQALEPALAYLRLHPDRLGALSGVDSARVAPLMARGLVKVKKMRDVAEAWLRRFPRAAAVGLVPELISSERENREVAAAALAQLRTHAAEVVEEVARELGPEWVAFDAASGRQTKKLGRKPTLPKFLELSTLPRPVKDGRALSGQALEELVGLLKLGRAERFGFEPESLARLSWELFSRWLYAGAPPKEKWCMQALSQFPSEEAAAALGPLAKAWAPGGSPTRAQDAVEVLAAMQTPAGLAQLMMLTKVQSKALRAKAEKVFAAQAAQMQLTPEDLADRLLPDFGPLERTTEVGVFKVRFDGKLKPALVDEAGSVVTLPSKVDAETREWWEELERGAPRLGRAQAKRLERSMVESKPMSLEHFTETYAMHPVLSALARGLLWGEYEGGKLVRALVLDGHALVDQRGTKVMPALSMGVVHPAELDAAELDHWRTRLTEQPFSQLGRPVRRLTQAALTTSSASLTGAEVATERLVSLTRVGWRQGPVFDGGCYTSIERVGQGARVTLSFSPGIHLGDWKLNATQTIEEVVVDGAASAALLSEAAVDLDTLR